MGKTMTKCNVLLAVVLMALATGCNTYYDASTVNAFLQRPRDSVVSADEYRIYPPDAISISSRTILELQDVTQQVRPDGYLNLPLLGEIYVAGKTPKEIEDVLAEQAKAYYEETDATVNIAGYNSQKYYIFGQVGGAGPRRWTGRDTLLDALASAQPTQLAWPERIWVVRGDSPQVGGQEWPEGKQASRQYRLWGVHPEQPGNPRHRMLVNLTAMYEKGDFSQNILLKPNDIIYVQANPFAKVGLAIQNVLFPVRPALSAMSTPAQFAAAGATP